MRRTAVSVTAFLLLAFAWATAESPPHVLPTGTAVVFISDASLEPGRREGSIVPVHLRDPLVLDGNVVAPAGTKAELRVGGSTASDGKRVTPAISLERFALTIGLLPVRSRQAIVAPVASGALIEATTLGEIDHVGDRYSIRIPFPFALPFDQPAAYYTPTPARTAPPRTLTPPRRGSPTPTPTPTPTATSSASDQPSPEATKKP